LIVNTFNKQRGNFLYWKDSRNALVNSGQVDGDRVETNRYMFGLLFKKVVYDNMVLNIKTNYYRNNFEDNGEPINKSTSHLYRGEVQVNASITESIMLTTGLELVPAKVNSSLFGNPTSFGAGVYAVTDINFNFPLIASLGIRYDYNKLDSLDTYGAVSPKIGFNFQPFNNLIFRTSLGTGFRAPSLAEAFTSTTSSGITIKPNPEIKPESNLTTEIGINFIPANIIELDFAAFHNEYYDMIEAGIDPQDGLAVFENVVRARIQGFEFNTVINLIPGNVKMNFGYTYLWARNIETGTALKYRPRHSFVSGINLNKWNIGLGINFRYSSKVEEIDDDLVNLGIVTDGELRVPVYLTDINLSYKLISIGLPAEIYLNIKNIFNYNYVELIGNLRPIRNYSLGFNLIL
jgi:outer membrane receptor protein involved in Fe transport